MAKRTVFRMAPNFEALIVQTEGVGRVLDVAADFVITRAQARVPRRLGKLKASIAKDVGLDDVAGRPSQAARIYARDFKAAWHEAGTARMRATPYLYPALLDVFPADLVRHGAATVRRRLL